MAPVRARRRAGRAPGPCWCSAARHRPVRRRAPQPSTAGRCSSAAVGRGGRRPCCAWRWTRGRPRPRASDLPLRDGRRVRPTARSSSTPRCPAASSATCTAACGTAATSGDVGRGAAGRGLGPRSAGQVVQVALAVVVLLAAAVAGALLDVPRAGSSSPSRSAARAAARSLAAPGRRARRVARPPCRDLRAWLLARSWPLVRGLGVRRRRSRRDVPGRGAHRGRRRPRPASWCRSRCWCCSRWRIPANVAGWGPREGVAAWAFARGRAGRVGRGSRPRSSTA